MSETRYRDENLANWNERVPIHAASRMYDLQGLVENPDRLSDVVAFDAPRLDDVAGKRLLHLQCHIGTDALSWARLGAQVTGLDFSGPAIEVARRAAASANLHVRFIEADVYDAVDALAGEQFDIVYTGVGAICWLPDIDRWAQIVSRLLRAGGTLYLRDGHPMLLAMDETSEELLVRYPYFQTTDPLTMESASTYTDGDAQLTHARTHEWNHSIGEIVTAVLNAGFTVNAFEEHQFLEWPFWPWMEQAEDGRYVLPDPLRARVPLMFTLMATKNSSHGD